MQRQITTHLIGYLLLLSVVVITPLATPCAGEAAFSISWYTIDSGGGKSDGGSWTMRGTIGQHDAAEMLSGGPYTVTGGFWPVATITEPPCPEDITGAGGEPDGEVNVIDLLELLASWGACVGCDADLNNDDEVNVIDLLQLLAAWGPCE